jgi:hypothetical protein
MSRLAAAIMIDGNVHERTNASHRYLMNCVVEKLQARDATPRPNKLVDLSAVVAGETYFFEIKPTTTENFGSQFRLAVSQLYECRYLQHAPDAKLVIIMGSPPATEDEWLIDYGVQSRGVLIAWKGSADNFIAARGCEGALDFLS